MERATRRLKVYVAGSSSWDNKGDAALLFALVSSLELEFGPIDVVCTSLTPEHDAPKYGLRFLRMPLAPDSLASGGSRALVTRLGVPQLAPVLSSLHLGFFLAAMRIWTESYRRLGRPALGVLPPRVADTVRAIDGSDLVVAVPGGYLMAPNPTDSLWLYHAACLFLAKILGKPPQIEMRLPCLQASPG